MRVECNFVCKLNDDDDISRPPWDRASRGRGKCVLMEETELVLTFKQKKQHRYSIYDYGSLHVTDSDSHLAEVLFPRCLGNQPVGPPHTSIVDKEDATCASRRRDVTAGGARAD
ncbi:hypothetical protein EVAR_85114_1 [Eumeta japonica]|uniref:Uncharacterized protein n=1 Tax=Eumeta variegata TaxID=151549 RepID=A0A4C1XPJ8_EUMVA|nr:hypothetical protein EVAR_85114_1 [Eumeta japonica]